MKLYPFWALAALCCVPPPVAPDTRDPGCDGACDTLERLGCPASEGSPGMDDEYGTPDDLACADTCRELERKGASFETECTAAATSCAGVEACFTDL